MCAASLFHNIFDIEKCISNRRSKAGMISEGHETFDPKGKNAWPP